MVFLRSFKLLCAAFLYHLALICQGFSSESLYEEIKNKPRYVNFQTMMSIVKDGYKEKAQRLSDLYHLMCRKDLGLEVIVQDADLIGLLLETHKSFFKNEKESIKTLKEVQNLYKEKLQTVGEFFNKASKLIQIGLNKDKDPSVCLREFMKEFSPFEDLYKEVQQFYVKEESLLKYKYDEKLYEAYVHINDTYENLKVETDVVKNTYYDILLFIRALEFREEILRTNHHCDWTIRMPMVFENPLEKLFYNLCTPDVYESDFFREALTIFKNRVKVISSKKELLILKDVIKRQQKSLELEVRKMHMRERLLKKKEKQKEQELKDFANKKLQESTLLKEDHTVPKKKKKKKKKIKQQVDSQQQEEKILTEEVPVVSSNEVQKQTISLNSSQEVVQKKKRKKKKKKVQNKTINSQEVSGIEEVKEIEKIFVMPLKVEEGKQDLLEEEKKSLVSTNNQVLQSKTNSLVSSDEFLISPLEEDKDDTLISPLSDTISLEIDKKNEEIKDPYKSFFDDNSYFYDFFLSLKEKEMKTMMYDDLIEVLKYMAEKGIIKYRVGDNKIIATHVKNWRTTMVVHTHGASKTNRTDIMNHVSGFLTDVIQSGQ